MAICLKHIEATNKTAPSVSRPLWKQRTAETVRPSMMELYLREWISQSGLYTRVCAVRTENGQSRS